MKKTLKCLLSVLCAFALLLSGLAVYADEPADAVEAPAAEAAANSSEEVKEDYPTKSVGGSYSPTLKNAEKTFRLAVKSSTHVTLIAEGSLAVRISVCEEETGSKVKGAESDNAEKPLILSFNAEAKNYLITAKALNGTSGKLRIQILDDEKYASWVKEREAAKEEKEAPAEEPEAVENAPAEEEPAAEPEIVEEAPAAEPEAVEEAPTAEPEPVEEEPAAEPEVIEEAPADEVEDEITIVDPESEPEEETESPAETASKTVYRFSDANISAVVTLSKASVIPDDAKLKVTHIKPGSRAYKAYMEALNKNGSMEYDASNSLIYDFAFLVDGIEVQAEDGTMKVDVTFKQNQLTELGAESAKDVSVKHLTLDEDVLDNVDKTVDADFTADDVHISSVGTSVSLDGNTDQVGFTVDGFSAFVFTTTVSPNASAPKITTQPADLTIAIGEKAVMKVVATGVGLTYQWWSKDVGDTSWTKITSDTGKTASRTIKGTAAMEGRKYKCIVYSSNGTKVTSRALTITIKPKITTQPADISLKVGEKATMAVVATGVGLTYQWWVKDVGDTSWTKITSDTGKTASRTIKGTAAMEGRLYKCIVYCSNGTKVTSRALKITVLPNITKQPTAKDIKAKTSMTMSVTATGVGLKYQWQYKDAKTTSWTSISGSTSASKTIKPSTEMNGRQYRCRVTDANGKKVYSSAVTLSVYGETSLVRYRIKDMNYASVIAYLGTAKSVTVPSKLDGYPVKQIFTNAFKGTSITSIVIPTSVTYIGQSAFENCKSLTTVTLSDKVSTIKPKAFKNCTKLTTMKIKN